MKFRLHFLVLLSLLWCLNLKASIPSTPLPNFVELAKLVRPAVVFISITKEIPVQEMMPMNPFFRDFFGDEGNAPGGGGNPYKGRRQLQEGLGSGFIVDLKKGYIFTNNHVVGDASEISVKTIEGKTYKAKVVGKDPFTDSAIIEVKNLPSTLKEIKLAKETDIEVGEWVLAIGAPMGLDQTVTHGIISAKSRDSINITERGNFIQTDAAINPGNSGGPLINMKGLVVGMNTAILSQSGGNHGIGLATSSDILEMVMPKLIRDGEVRYSKIGIQIQDLDEDMKRTRKLNENQFGVMIAGVMPGSPGEKSGLKDQDVIYKVDGVEIKDAAKLRREVGFKEPGASIKVDFYRNGKAMSANVKTERLNGDGSENKDDQNTDDAIGFKVEEYDGSVSGVQVTSVDRGHLSWRKGVRMGQIITKVDGKAIRNVSEFFQAIKGKKEFEIRVTDPRGQYSNYFIIKRGQ